MSLKGSMMRTLIYIISFAFLFVGCQESKTTHKTSHSRVKHNEKYYQTKMCRKLGGKMEYRLPDATRIDCLTSRYAIEVDFAKKWAESVGQSLYYAKMSGKKPAVGLIVDSSKREKKYLKRLNTLARSYGIKVFILRK
jgi:hypothetical protein